MSTRIQLNGGNQIQPGTLTRALMNTTTAGSAVLNKVIAGTNISLSSTGVDAGTGDVTINVTSPIPVLNGGTGSTTASAARTALGVAGGNLPATATNDNATAGNVGEYVSSTIATASAVALSNGVAANVTSISLTAGDWDVSADIQYKGGTTTTVSYIEGDISTTSATLSADNSLHYMNNVVPFNMVTTISNVIGPRRISISATTTVYLVTLQGFATSTMSAFGTIRARRVR